MTISVCSCTNLTDAMLNDRLTNVEENPLFAADTDVYFEERLG